MRLIDDRLTVRHEHSTWTGDECYATKILTEAANNYTDILKNGLNVISFEEEEARDDGHFW